ncbi:MAG: hypothetical protein IJV15_05135 [Lachnospiraceae bacterium]|nr:hypothetical protein [Lachnospiraceae bacterium]
MDIKSLSDSFTKIGQLDTSRLFEANINIPKFETPQMPELDLIDPEETIIGDIKRKIEEQNDLTSQQMGILIEQNQLLTDNYNKLKNLYDQQVYINAQSNEELKRSRKYNRWMMVIAIIAMLAAIAGPIVTIIVSR